LEIIFELEPTQDDLQTEADQVFQERLKKYPTGIKCPGSFFKNVPFEKVPEDKRALIDPAKIKNDRVHVGWLLETVGARGMEVGGIRVTDYHANLMVNQGNGTAQDVYNLAKDLAGKVKEKYGVELEPEVQFVNLPSLF
jgi:UDP-N-acetylmuramate dehydrogenase